MQSIHRSGNVVGICFMIFWVCAVSGMGIMALQSGAPLFFAFVPFGMAAVGIVACLSFFRQGHEPQEFPFVTRTVTYSGDSSTEYVPSRTHSER